MSSRTLTANLNWIEQTVDKFLPEDNQYDEFCDNYELMLEQTSERAGDDAVSEVANIIMDYMETKGTCPSLEFVRSRALNIIDEQREKDVPLSSKRDLFR